MRPISLLLPALLLLSPLAVGSARAANADQPYQNVNKANDAGNNTGDAQVDKLNNGQLDENQKPASK
jgi:hypothetical protein